MILSIFLIYTKKTISYNNNNNNNKVKFKKQNKFNKYKFHLPYHKTPY